MKVQKDLHAFKYALANTMAHEGGFILHSVPGDPGGMTYAGISRVYQPSWPGWALIDSGVVSSPELSHMTRELYYSKFWVPSGLHSDNAILSNKESSLIFDIAVNSGVRSAVRIMQRVSGMHGVDVDGVLGPVTNASFANFVCELDEETVLMALTLARIDYYTKLVLRRPKLSKFFKGWIVRSMSFVQ